MGSRLIKGIKHFACYDEFEEKKYEEHITNKHGFDSRLQSQYSKTRRRNKGISIPNRGIRRKRF
jgi:hypothetical protein